MRKPNIFDEGICIRRADDFQRRVGFVNSSLGQLKYTSKTCLWVKYEDERHSLLGKWWMYLPHDAGLNYYG